MRPRFSFIVLGLAVLGPAGCVTPERPEPVRRASLASPAPVAEVVPVQFAEIAKVAEPAAPLGLPGLTEMALERNPRLGQVTWAVETARGRAIQAGLYPNPKVDVAGNELGDINGPSGIWTAFTTQEIVTANKLGLSKAAALRDVDRATLGVISERYRVLTDVRQNFLDLLVLRRREAILTELIGLAEKSVDTSNKLLAAKVVARLDVVQLEVELERYRAERDATRQSLAPAFRRLAASIGVPDLPLGVVEGDLETALPDYDLDRLRVYVLGIHPDVRSAQIEVERAKLLARRAEVEPIPNVTVGAGVVRQGQNRSNDWDVGVSVPVPLWNRNQGNILAAAAQVNEAMKAVERTGNDLVGRLATAFEAYAAARQRAERYKTAILPKAQETFQLSTKAYQGGQFEYLRVLQAQRALAEARLEALRATGEMWRAAAEIAGLSLEDDWPITPTPQGKQP